MIQTCTLYFTHPVGLMLNGSIDSGEIWSTRELNLSTKASFNTLLIDDTGCLYMKAKDEDPTRLVWKSFDYPGDTLVKGQQLMPGISMSAAQVNQNYSNGGIFTMRVEGDNMTLYQGFNAEGVLTYIPYTSFANTTQNNMQNIAYVQVGNGLLAFYGGNTLRTLTPTGPDNWDYARLESNGGLVLKNYSEAQIELVGDGNNCSLPAECGSAGMCLQNGTCTCPEGFANSTPEFTCQPTLPLTLDCSNHTKFVNITGQTYLNISTYSSISTLENMNLSACKTLCQESCTCANALHVIQDTLEACFFNLDPIPTIRQVEVPGNVQTLFLRINSTTDNEPVGVAGGSGSSSRRTAASAFAGGAGALVLVLLVMSAWWLLHTRRKYFDEAERGLYDPGALELPQQYSYKELADSTSNFAQRLGYGGRSAVYAGSFPNGKIAVKSLDGKTGKEKEFLAAVAAMSNLSNPNLVPLVGFCKEGKHKMLVYELVNEGRSLNWFLFNPHDSGPLMDAQTRRSVALETARGLQHLHSHGVVHGGVKPETVMIDRAMHPKLVDYGLVNLTSRFATLHSGARGYIAPEWMNPAAALTAKVDVYSLGVVTLELVSGRRCLLPEAAPEEKRFLPTWGFALLERGNHDLDSVLALVDPRLDVRSARDQQVLQGMTFVALWCVQADPALRPSIDDVVRMLEGDLTVNAPPLSPALDQFARDLCHHRSGELPPPNSEMRPR
jgi:hypothetical protein